MYGKIPSGCQDLQAHLWTTQPLCFTRTRSIGSSRELTLSCLSLCPSPGVSAWPSPPGTARLHCWLPVTKRFLQVPRQDTALTMVLWDHSGPALTLSPYNAPLACTPAQGGTAGSCSFSSPRAAAMSVSCTRTLDTALEMFDRTLHLAQGSVPAHQSASPGQGSRVDIRYADCQQCLAADLQCLGEKPTAAPAGIGHAGEELGKHLIPLPRAERKGLCSKGCI